MKKVLLSFAYVIVLFTMVSLTDLAFYWVFNKVLFKVINWYNELNFFFKFLLFIFAFGIFYTFIQLLEYLLILLNAAVFYWFPSNLFTLSVSILVFISNTAYSIRELWKSMPAFNFLITMEFIILCFFLISVNYIFINRHGLKERISNKV